MILYFFLFLNVAMGLNAADMEKARQDGLEFIYEKKWDSKDEVKSVNKFDVPGYETDTPPEMNLDQHTLKDKALIKKEDDDAANYIQKNSSDPNRKKYNIETEDLLINAENATKDPLKTMNEIVMEEQASDATKDETFECEESGEAYHATCSKSLEIDLEIIPEIKETKTWCSGHGRRYGFCGPIVRCGGCQSKTTIKQQKKVRPIRKEWKTDCGYLEALSEKGLCVYGKKEVGGQETRIIQGESVTEPSWSERYTYICKKDVLKEKSCDALKAKRCKQVDSRCLEFANGICVLWKYTYKCYSTTKKRTTYLSNGQSSPFCLTGNCADTTYPVNTEIMNAFSHLAILKQAQEDGRNNIGIFKGNGLHCTKHCVNFTDCCGGNGGWGVSVGLSRCSGAEKELLEHRKKGLCIDLGEYCAEKFLGACIRKKRGFCCFGSKLSKTIQEQGRRQLGLKFGSAQYPDCRALTPDELSRLDFSKMDLTPLYDEISKKMKIPDQGHMAKGIELDRIRENMKMLTNQPRKIS